ncbi:hypothetical protein ColKHC_05236 [Colletotrichum higginsianum]|nr:hypothetical protein ColKHC_05236 [Colletotrichum higginsianum]
MVHNGRCSVFGTSDDNIPEMDVLKRIARGLVVRYTATNSDQNGHLDVRERLEHWGRQVPGVDIARHSGRTSNHNDIVASHATEPVHVVVVIAFKLGIMVGLIEHKI